MGFAEILKGVVIAFIGGILALLGLGIITFPTLLQIYGFPNLGIVSLPFGIVSIIFGLALLIYGQKLAGIR
ncbi:MAG: hypothetical protein ABSD73_05175 [Candidatus Bathyarchaeia archaeon]|jgi:hypothetical protein